MSETGIKAKQPAGDGEISFLDIAIVIAKHKKSVLLTPVLVAFAAALLTFALPKSYTATTRLLPPQQAQSGAAALLSQLGGISAMAGAAGGLKNPNDLYIGMLTSRTVGDRLVARFKLSEVYDIASWEKTRNKLRERSQISSGRDGLIVISVDDRSPERSAQMANAYVGELMRLTKLLAVTEAAQRRVFFEHQLQATKDKLANAESKLKNSLERNGVVSVDGESRAIVETVGRLRAQASAKEIQLGAMQSVVTPSNPAYRQIQAELSSLRAELSKLENGRPDLAASAAAGATETQKTGLENIKGLRDVKYYQMLYELLAKQYEVARLDEAKDAAIIQVLDEAVIPERKSKPRRVLIVLTAAFLALLGAIAFAFIREARARAMDNPAEAARWNEFMSHLRLR